MILSHHKLDKDHACSHWHVGEATALDSDGMATTFDHGAWKYQTGGPVIEHRQRGTNPSMDSWGERKK